MSRLLRAPGHTSSSGQSLVLDSKADEALVVSVLVSSASASAATWVSVNGPGTTQCDAIDPPRDDLLGGFSDLLPEGR